MRNLLATLVALAAAGCVAAAPENPPPAPPADAGPSCGAEAISWCWGTGCGCGELVFRGPDGGVSGVVRTKCDCSAEAKR